MTNAQEVTDVDSREQAPVVTRGRILLLALLVAFVWLLLTVIATSAPAVADESDTDRGALLDAVGATIEEIAPVPAVTEPVVAVVDRAVEPLKPVVEPVARHAAVEPVARVAEATLNTTATVADKITEPVLEQPVVAETIAVVNGIIELSPSAPDLTGENVSAPTLAEAEPSALEANRPGPVAVRSTAVTPDTRVTDVPATGPSSSQDGPGFPMTPVTPASATAPSLSQWTGAPSLLADLSGGGNSVAPAGASVAWVDFAVPPSPTFDSDTSPD
jgi:hypothetical protein